MRSGAFALHASDGAAPLGDRPASWHTTLGALRARDWLHFVVLPLAALPAHPLPGQLRALPFAVAAAAGALAFAYGLNAIADRRSDDPAKNALAGATGALARTGATVAGAGALAAAAAALVDTAAFGWIVVSLVAGASYSAGPRLKRLPVLGLVANTIIFAPLLFLEPGARPAGFAVLATTFVALLVQNQLVHELADAEEDARERVFTTARALGPTRTRTAVCGVAAAGGLAAASTAPSFAAAVIAVLGLAVGAGAAVAGDAGRARRLHRTLAIAIGASLWAATR